MQPKELVNNQNVTAGYLCNTGDTTHTKGVRSPWTNLRHMRTAAAEAVDSHSP